ncbi:unnamed protein product [Linum trigynum]|uniref:Uncharacterized protein n=1 Tax=Linum trigynum TaxID=586398 RepID=A0AAV2EY65_9ROSI
MGYQASKSEDNDVSNYQTSQKLSMEWNMVQMRRAWWGDKVPTTELFAKTALWEADKVPNRQRNHWLFKTKYEISRVTTG